MNLVISIARIVLLPPTLPDLLVAVVILNIIPALHTALVDVGQGLKAAVLGIGAVGVGLRHRGIYCRGGVEYCNTNENLQEPGRVKQWKIGEPSRHAILGTNSS